jgi:carbonic anhydrase
LEAYLLASEGVPQDLVQEKSTWLQRLDALASSVEVVEQAIVQAHIKCDADEAAIQAQLQGETEPYKVATTFAAAVAVFKGNLAKKKADGFAAEEHYREAIQVLAAHFGKKDARVAAVTILLKNAFVYS